MAVLMQRTPKQLDNVLVDCYQKVMQLEGVQGVQVSTIEAGWNQVKGYISVHSIVAFESSVGNRTCQFCGSATFRCRSGNDFLFLSGPDPTLK
jgi:hypothetical protein